MADVVETFVAGFHDEAAVRKMKYNRLGNTGMHVSEVSIGGVALGGLYGDFDRAECLRTVDLALRSGVNLIDTSPWYGQGKSEEFLGEALRDVPREAYYLATKVGRYDLDYAGMFDFSAARVRRSVELSLRRLRLQHVDLLQVHDLEFCPDLETIVSETLPALQEMVDEGKARCIGITGYPVSTLKEVVKRSKVKIDSILSYSRNNLHDDTLQSFLPFFQERNIAVIDAGATSMGLLSPNGPPAWHPASDLLKSTTLQLQQHCKSQGSDLTRLALRHFMTRPGVTSHLMGVVSRDQLKQNLQMYQLPVSAEEDALLQHVLSRYASLPAEHHHWEGKEVAHYRKAMAGLDVRSTFEHLGDTK
ncbi:L-galactose dehydrogenase-like [Pollicipes pollicipes]|uniref:L-galactose dehydrogenase-like n=1 Tax=Pollicipes pollicipes TaxID=41117 RepID=UPI0018851724|nr:L-galactose dehydrogenase-like [Pollicipes pollicipes]XP_037075986.1 L-galactose dehydrogenase-like [Pollicipes pollicipes]